MGKDRHGKNGRSGGAGEPEAGGYQLPAVAWAVEELEPPTAEEAPAAPVAKAPAARESRAPAIGSEAEPSAEHEPKPEAEHEPEAEPDSAADGGAADGGDTAALAAATGLLATTPASKATAAAGQGGTSSRPGRISKPMIAAAATAGVVLIGLPLILSHLGGGGSHGGPLGSGPAGYTQQSGGGDGFVPKADAHGDIGPGPQAPGQPGQPGQPPQGGTGGADGGTTGGGGTGGVAGAAALAGAGAGAGTGSGAGAPVGSSHGGGSGGAAQPQQPGQPQTQPQPPAQPQQPAPQQPAPPAAAAKAAPPAAPSYAGVAGPFCSNAGTTFQQNGWFDQGQAGWVVNSGGGYAGSGCNGNFTSMPMSGAANKDAGNSVVWTFNTGSVSSGSCTISVYVPDDGDIKAVGGAPAYYTVQNGSGSAGSFNVNQVGNRGSWVSAGTFPVSNGKIAVTMHDRGQDWTDTAKTYAHDAASAVRANCTG
ncbi:cell division septation protein DedD [Kitasatospora sp. MAP12-15]|uniref:hypothetical protein n=1 Tax=unclassified Kitasatospora TaxID=2633591 RepID=UPI002474DBA8|nr:hypothetical protein [Kitasatospora sp. MAP12-44]MDH6108926.1 cell division septation protein DedD [Kitasatospora sp. MAP12-44]